MVSTTPSPKTMAVRVVVPRGRVSTDPWSPRAIPGPAGVSMTLSGLIRKWSRGETTMVLPSSSYRTRGQKGFSDLVVRSSRGEYPARRSLAGMSETPLPVTASGKCPPSRELSTPIRPQVYARKFRYSGRIITGELKVVL